MNAVLQLRAFRMWTWLAPLMLAACFVRTSHARAQAQVRVEMTADRTELSLNDHVVVRISVQTQSADSPEIALPEMNGFDVVQRSVQRPMQFSFGLGQRAVVASSTNYTFVLQPVAAGTFNFSPVVVRADGKTYKSQALRLVVRDGGGQTSPPGQATQPGTGAPGQDAQHAQGAAQNAGTQAAARAGSDVWTFDNDAFLRTVVDKPEPYVGEQVTATIYLYTRRNLQQIPHVLAEATTDGFWTHDLMNPARPIEPSRQVVNGRAFFVYALRRFAAFPLKSGELTLGAMSLEISRESIFDIFDPGRAQPNLTRTGVPVLLQVKALPEDGKPAGDVAVGRLSLRASLDRAQVATGDAVTLTATIEGTGNLRTVRIATPRVDGLQILEPENREQIESPGDLVQGTRKLRWIVVPKQPGEHVIPALKLATFDPEGGRYHLLETDPLTITAAGNAPAGAATDAPDTAQRDADHDDADTASEDPSEDLLPIRTTSSLRRREAALASHPLYPIALLAPPLVWLATVAFARVRRRSREKAEAGGPKQTLRNAQARLQEARAALEKRDEKAFHALLAAAIHTALEARLGAPVLGLTQTQLKSTLVASGMHDELSSVLLSALSRCDFARFSSAAVSDDEMRKLLHDVTARWDALVRFEPTHAARAEERA